MTDGKREIQPSFICWHWMRSILGLSGNEMMIFAYLWSLTFGGTSYTASTLADMESWFGLTRQTISKYVDNLQESGYVTKTTLQDTKRRMIKHNYYKVNMANIISICEDASYESYLNFIDSYKNLFIAKFPDEEKKIDVFFDKFINWHKSKNKIMSIKLSDVCSVFDDEASTFEDLIKSVLNNTDSTKNTPKKRVKKEESAPDTPKYETNVEKRRKNPKVSAKMDKLIQMNLNFVLNHAENSQELLELLNMFVTDGKGTSYTPTQWEAQLYDLNKYSTSIDSMIESVRNSYKNGYRSVVYKDKSLVEIDKKKYMIGNFCSLYENTDKLQKLLTSYVTDTQHGKSCTIGQFDIMLTKLADSEMSVEDMVECVENAYAGGWKSFTYGAKVNTSIDMDEKRAIIDKFIKDGYYYLVPDLKKYLLMYIETTANGMSMTADMFELNLNQLRLNCVTDNDKVRSVMNAITGNKNVLSYEDFSETKAMRQKGTSRDSSAKQADSTRKLHVEKHKKMHPNDPLVADVVIETKPHKFV